MRFLKAAFSDTIFAYSLAFAVAGTPAERVAIYPLPPAISRDFLFLSSSATVRTSTGEFLLESSVIASNISL